MPRALAIHSCARARSRRVAGQPSTSELQSTHADTSLKTIDLAVPFQRLVVQSKIFPKDAHAASGDKTPSVRKVLRHTELALLSVSPLSSVPHNLSMASSKCSTNSIG